LQNLGLTLETVRAEVMQYLGDPTKTSKSPESGNAEKLKVQRKFLNDAKLWAINEDNYDLATLLRDAVEEVERRIEVARKEQDI